MPASEVIYLIELIWREMCQENIAASIKGHSFLPDTLSQRLSILHMIDSHHLINAPGAIVA
jgi:hypothetical protein